MPSFHVLAPNITEADAVAQDALGMVRALRAAGYEACLYADHCESAVTESVRDLSDYQDGPARSASDVLVYHHAVGWQPGLDLYRSTRNRRILKFHNVTPARFFEGIDAEYVNSCLHGDLHTKVLLAVPTDLFLADSPFNAEELAELGAPRDRIKVLPPFHDVQGLLDIQADLGIVRDYQDDVRNILFVGRVAPNKGHPDLLEVFSHYHHHLNPRSRLHVVGTIDPRLRSYTEEIRRTIWRLRLEGTAILTGSLTPPQLKAHYLTAHAFLCTSRHEGFCVPLAEAMAFKIPCVAWASTAVASTLGPNCLSWAEFDPMVLAESLHACVEDPQIREQVVRRQLVRYRGRFGFQAIAKQFYRALDSVFGPSVVVLNGGSSDRSGR
jgi:glycosyltransferase involved in cell wall biosynthesis